MAELCVDCLNKIFETNYSKKKFIISEELDICEECGVLKQVIVMERKYYYLRKFRFVIFPLKIRL